MGYPHVSDDKLKEAHRYVLDGESIKDACEKSGFHPATYYLRRKKGTLPRTRRVNQASTMIDLSEEPVSATLARAPIPSDVLNPQNLRGKVVVLFGDAETIFSSLKGILQ